MNDLPNTKVNDLQSHDAAPTTAKTVAVIGLGNMGGAMAAHLIDSGFSTTVYCAVS